MFKQCRYREEKGKKGETNGRADEKRMEGKRTKEQRREWTRREEMYKDVTG